MSELRAYPIPDLRTRVEIQHRLRLAEGLDASRLAIDVAGSEVWLRGWVRSEGEARRAEEVVRAVGGVARLRAELRVEGAPAG